MFTDFFQVAFQHVQNIYRILIILWIHVVFLVFDIGRYVLHQPF